MCNRECGSLTFPLQKWNPTSPPTGLHKLLIHLYDVQQWECLPMRNENLMTNLSFLKNCSHVLRLCTDHSQNSIDESWQRVHAYMIVFVCLCEDWSIFCVPCYQRHAHIATDYQESFYSEALFYTFQQAKVMIFLLYQRDINGVLHGRSGLYAVYDCLILKCNCGCRRRDIFFSSHRS